MELNIKNKRQIKLNNIKTTKELKLLIDVGFKAKVTKVLNS
jgi:hypothetical protein